MTQTFNDTNIPDHAKLVAFASRGGHIQFSMGDKTTVGRGEVTDIKQNVLTLDCDFLGEKQFNIFAYGKKWMFTCTCFDNETWINKARISDGEPVELKNGDLITIIKNGKVQSFLFQDYFDEAVEWKSILLINKNRVTTLYSDEALRSIAAHPDIVDKEALPHIDISYSGGNWFMDLSKIKESATVNGKKVTSKSIKLSLYDVIGIGDNFYVYFPGRLAYNVNSFSKKQLIVHIKDRTVKNHGKKKTLLKDISLTIDPGSFVLLLGGSGAGKTTLINAITGYEKANAQIINAGVDVYQNYNQMKYEIAVVPQQDLLRGTDSVYMTLMNAAELRLPRTMSKKEKKEKVEALLTQFGLQSVKHSLVKSLSGGQRKRLSISTEYIGDPSLFILDEPDSGLDGIIARELMEHLRQIADEGKIVIVITHTPDRVSDLFDHIIVLAKNSEKTGQVAFYGTLDEARTFFDKPNMEGILRSINNVDEGGEGKADEHIKKYQEMKKGSTDHD